MTDRFVVAVTDGFLAIGVGHRGVSAVVLDSSYCYAPCAQFRSEDMHRGAGGYTSANAPARAVALARERAAELNAKHA